MLGDLRTALERHQVGECRDDGRVGEEYDMERDAPDRRTQPEGLPKGGDAEQEGNAGGGSPTGVPP